MSKYKILQAQFIVGAMRGLLGLCLGGGLLSSEAFAAPDLAAPVVVTEVSEHWEHSKVKAVGLVAFERIAKVSSEVSGVIDEYRAREGGLVEQGELLVRINTDFLHKDIQIARTEVEQVEVHLQRSGKKLQRLQTLINSRSTSQHAYEEAQSAHRVLEKQRELLQQRITRLDLQIDKSTVRAPFAGIIIAKHQEQGEWASPRSPLFQIASIDDIRVRVALSEKLLRYQHPGEPVVVEIPALEQTLNGTLARVSPVADLRSNRIYVDIRIPYVDRLIQNMSATALVRSGESRQVRHLRRDALIGHGEGDAVFTVANGKAKLLAVNVVSRRGGVVSVDDAAIQAGMVVVIDGNDRLRSEQAVLVRP